MSETAKKVLLIVVTIVALVVAGLGAAKMMSGEKIEVEKTIAAPPGHKSEKEMALSQQNNAGGAPQERDLAGGIPTGGGGKANDR